MTHVSSPAAPAPMLIARERASSHGQQRGAPVTRTTLTLLHLPAKRTGSAIYGLSTLDAGGRIADRAIMQALGWTPQQRLDIRVSRGLIGVFADERGVFRVSSQRFLHLPVAARRWCDLAAGSRVLLAAYPEGGLLLVYPPAVLDDVVAQVFDAVWGSDVDG